MPKIHGNACELPCSELIAVSATECAMGREPFCFDVRMRPRAVVAESSLKRTGGRRQRRTPGSLHAAADSVHYELAMS